jgi:outer membrane immunogenic protein
MKPIWFAATVVAALASPAMTAGAADLPYTKAPVAAVYNWTGLYIGGTVGGGWQRSRTDYASDPSYHLGSIIFIPALDFGVLARSTSQNGAGVLGGMTLGYNWQRDAVVFGVEGDWSWTGLKATSVTTPVPCCAFPALTTITETRTDWLATLRGRIGVLAAPQTLLFVTGGLALGEIRTSTNVVPSSGGSTCANNSLCAAGAASATRAGWTAGAGLEQGFAGNWTVKVEYLHYDLGSVSHIATEASPAFPVYFGQPVLNVNTKVSGEIGRVGVNYRF